MSKLKFEYFNYIGARENNEDACLAHHFGNETYLFAVADGMGGEKAGEVASQIAINTLKECVSESIKSKKSDEEFILNLKSILSTACMAIQTDLADLIREDPSKAGMGTTLVSVLICKGKYAFVNIGDSRGYIIKENKLNQLTEDHSYLEEFKKSNTDPIPDYIVKSYGHLVTRILNGGRDKPDVYPPLEDYYTLSNGEGFLLCSDGLIPTLALNDPSELEKILDANTNFKNTGNRMIEWAEKNGSTDNISLVLVKS